jgi:peptidoglycan/LPS O-acetylase OafA/YrhL
MIQPITDKNLAYRPDIDGLRAIAVLAVVAYHVEPQKFRGGFVGVDIFFVISGFLISSIIYKELGTGTFSILEFYIRRIRRIYPALAIVLACTCVAGWLFLLPTDFVSLGKQVLGGSTFVANVVLWWQSGYFSDDAIRKPLLHLWSLGVEEQYYLFFPLLCALFYRTKSKWNLPVVFATVALISMIINVAFVKKYPDASYYLPFSRLWELFLGAGLALYVQRRIHTWEDHLNPAGRTALSIVGLVMLGASIIFINERDSFPGWVALGPTVGTALVIFAGPLAWANRTILSWKPVVLVGLISYPLYLWHWPLFSFSRLINEAPRGRFVLDPMLVVSSFVLAYLTYRFVETPIRLVKDRARRRRGALWLVGCVLITGAFGVVVIAAHGFPSRWPGTIVGLDHKFGEDLEAATQGRRCFLDADQTPKDFGSECVDPETGNAAQPLVLLWGDSHAADLVPGFRALQPKTGWRMAQYTASLCPPIEDVDIPERPACRAINDDVLKRIRTLKPQIVILSAFWDYTGWLVHHEGFTRNYAAKLLRTIQDVKAAGVPRVVVVGSAPYWVMGVPTLMMSEVRKHPNDPVPQRLSRRYLQTHNDVLLKVVTEQGGAEFVSIFDALCDSTSCQVMNGQDWHGMMTSDPAHFTVTGSTIVDQDILEQMNQPAK